MYKLSKKQVSMFVRAIMPELYRMQEVYDCIDELDRMKPYEQQHQRGHTKDSPRIAWYKARLSEKSA